MNTTHHREEEPQEVLGISRPVRMIGVAWGAIFVISVLIFLIFTQIQIRILSAALLSIGTIFLLYSLIQLTSAKKRAMSEMEVSVLNGLAKLISWNPTEGVLFLKNKQIEFIDDDLHDGGNIRTIYPFLGEELVLRVPLEIQTFNFEDGEVLTKEYIPLTIKGEMYWRITDLRLFYLYVSKELHSLTDKGAHSIDIPNQKPQLEIAEQWLRSMAEEKTRAIVSRVGTGLLISDQLASDLSNKLPNGGELFNNTPQSSSGYQSATEGLSISIKNESNATVEQYGLDIHRVALQEVKLPPEIYSAAVDACKSAYKPLKAKAEAIEKRMILQAEADVIGKDAAGLKQIVSKMPASSIALQEYLAPMFHNLSKKRGLGDGESSKEAE